MITLTREEAQQVLDALKCIYNMDKERIHHQAITILRARLAQPEPKAKYNDIISDGGLDPRNKYDQQPEPVGWIYEDDEGRMMFSQMPENPPFWEPVYRSRSVPTKLMNVGGVLEKVGYIKKKEWQGLTDEEMMQLYIELKSVAGFYSLEKYGRSIEAKLKEKNHG